MLALCLLLALGAGSIPSQAPAPRPEREPGTARGLAIFAAKALTAASDGAQVIDNAVLLVRDGHIDSISSASERSVPAEYETLDLGTSWIMPGMIDLHSHIAGSGGDINDMVFQTNEGLRVSCAVVPRNPQLQRVLAAGVTTVLFIPGSGTNVGGQGILLKTAPERFEEMRLRDPGSLKIAQADNPARWGYGMGRGMMNYHVRSTVRRGLAYARAQREAEERGGDSPARNLQFDVFRDLLAGATQISTHTQVYQVVLMTITMLKGEFGLDVYIDHGEWQGYLATPLALKLGVNAIVGPREVDTPEGRAVTDGRIVGCAAGYQERGMTEIGFNTDAPVVPGEELPLQAAMGVRYGFENAELQAVRGLTIVPARTAGIDQRVGSLEPGKDADFVVLSGDPADPRTLIEAVWIEGRLVHEAAREGELR